MLFEVYFRLDLALFTGQNAVLNILMENYPTDLHSFGWKIFQEVSRWLFPLFIAHGSSMSVHMTNR